MLSPMDLQTNWLTFVPAWLVFLVYVGCCLTLYIRNRVPSSVRPLLYGVTALSVLSLLAHMDVIGPFV